MRRNAMLQKFGLHRKDKSQQTSDPKIPELPPEPFHLERSYSTEELLCIFDYASSINYSGIKVFKEQGSSEQERDLFINLILMNLPSNSPQATGPTVDISEVNVDFDSKARISLNIKAESIPYIVTTIIKRSMINWDFFGQRNEIAQNLLDAFKSDFFDTVEEVNNKNQNKSAKFSALDRFTSKLLSPLSEYKNPELMFATEMLLIAFITDLTAHGYTEQAKVLHTFLTLCKQIISQAHPNTLEHEKTVRLLALPVIRALRLTSDVDFTLTPFVTCMLNLTLGHRLFNEPYDIEIYLMLYRLFDKSKQLGIFIATSPSLIERGTGLPINKDIDTDYQTLVDTLANSKHKTESRKAVTAFFRTIISRHCQFARGTKAQDIHNFLYILVTTAKENEHNPHQYTLLAKILRMFLQIPSSTPEQDNLFDTQIIRLIFATKHEHEFMVPFNIADYELSLRDARRYCQQLQSRLQDAQTELHDVHEQILILQGLLRGKEDDYARLTAELTELKLTDKQASPKSSPQHSPSSSPPKERITRRHGPNKKDSQPTSTVPSIHHTKSESEIRRPRKLT